MKKILATCLLFSIVTINTPAFASTSKYVTKAKGEVHKLSQDYNGTHGKNGQITPKSIGAGALSLLIWPGIGQLMNDENNTEKAAVHALLGFTGVFRIWSGYDGIVNRKGGVWNNRI